MLFRVHLLRELLVGLLCLAFTHPLADQVEDLLLGNLHGRLLASLLLSVSPGATPENSSWRKLPARGPKLVPARALGQGQAIVSNRTSKRSTCGSSARPVSAARRRASLTDSSLARIASSDSQKVRAIVLPLSRSAINVI